MYREYLKNKRNNLTFDLITKKSHKIFQLLIKHPEYIKAKKLIIYCSKDYEVQTEKIIKYSLTNGKRVIVPITNQKKRILEFSEIKDFDKELEISTFNIPEPKKEFIRYVNIDDIQLVIIPGLGFDQEGGRLGYGFGYFDRFLNSLKNPVLIIGLAFELQLVDRLPLSTHDVKVNFIITENRVINCSDYK
ncbi:MAG: 5-formyltetrahydrofolate cyclo-ligase [Candidatus Helarchaeota archaeon]